MRKLGKVFVNAQGKEAVVIGVSSKSSYGNYTYKIKFIQSGYTCDVDGGNLNKGVFKDYGEPTVCGVGYSYKGANSTYKVYKTWAHMLERCYNPRFHAYPNYGGRGVKVCERWLHFKNFEEDIKGIPNYEEYIADHTYSLDKDIKGKGLLYSKENCMFANPKDQGFHRRNVRKIKCISKDGEEVIFNSFTEACKALGVQDSNIRKVMSGERKHTKGYRFERVG